MEVNYRPALAAAKASPETLSGVDRETRRPLLVERAKALPLTPVSLELPSVRLAIRQQGILINDAIPVHLK